MQSEESVYALGVVVSGPVMNRSDRPNMVITLLVDVSGSMNAAYTRHSKEQSVSSLLDVAKLGITSLLSQLKEGDVVNLVTFSASATTVLSGWYFDESDTAMSGAVSQLTADASTNLADGITEAYAVATQYFDPKKANRVIILTDANANTGPTVNPNIISENIRINDSEGIYFSGVGIGESFNDQFLNELTDKGKGAYAAMITPQDAERIFSQDFMRFLDPAVRDVKFKLSYPGALAQYFSAAEQQSQESENVDSTNFSYNSSQFFLELFKEISDLNEDDYFELELFYTDDVGVKQSRVISKTIAALKSLGSLEIKSAIAVTTLAQLVAETVSCEDVLASGLYSQEIRTYVFEKYRQGIDDFCQLSE